MEHRKEKAERILGKGCTFDGTEHPHGHSGKGRKNGDELLNEMLANAPNGQLLFVGSVNCLRHKPYMGIGKLMREGRASVLCPAMSDFSTGRYLRQIEEAILELSRELSCKQFVITFGCQWVILSTDGEMLQRKLKEDYDIELSLFDDSHLEAGDHR